MRHEFGFQFEFRQFRQVQSTTKFEVWSSVFRNYPVSTKMSRAFQFRHLRSSDFDDGKLVQTNSFSRSTSDEVFRTEYFVPSGYWNGCLRCDPGVGQTPKLRNA